MQEHGLIAGPQHFLAFAPGGLSTATRANLGEPMARVEYVVDTTPVPARTTQEIDFLGQARAGKSLKDVHTAGSARDGIKGAPRSEGTDERRERFSALEVPPPEHAKDSAGMLKVTPLACLTASLVETTIAAVVAVSS